MTDEHLALLKSSIDQIVLLETTDGEQIVAQILFVFDEGETPDLFYLKVAPNSDGIFVTEGSGGYSLLLSDVASVSPLES
jgi:hypothetical protein